LDDIIRFAVKQKREEKRYRKLQEKQLFQLFRMAADADGQLFTNIKRALLDSIDSWMADAREDPEELAKLQNFKNEIMQYNYYGASFEGAGFHLPPWESSFTNIAANYDIDLKSWMEGELMYSPLPAGRDKARKQFYQLVENIKREREREGQRIQPTYYEDKKWL